VSQLDVAAEVFIQRRRGELVHGVRNTLAGGFDGNGVVLLKVDAGVLLGRVVLGLTKELALQMGVCRSRNVFSVNPLTATRASAAIATAAARVTATATTPTTTTTTTVPSDTGGTASVRAAPVTLWTSAIAAVIAANSVSKCELSNGYNLNNLPCPRAVVETIGRSAVGSTAVHSSGGGGRGTVSHVRWNV
jgi:hypothetical protein